MRQNKALSCRERCLLPLERMLSPTVGLSAEALVWRRAAESSTQGSAAMYSPWEGWGAPRGAGWVVYTGGASGPCLKYSLSFSSVCCILRRRLYPTRGGFKLVLSHLDHESVLGRIQLHDGGGGLHHQRPPGEPPRGAVPGGKAWRLCCSPAASTPLAEVVTERRWLLTPAFS